MNISVWTNLRLLLWKVWPRIQAETRHPAISANAIAVSIGGITKITAVLVKKAK